MRIKEERSFSPSQAMFRNGMYCYFFNLFFTWHNPNFVLLVRIHVITLIYIYIYIFFFFVFVLLLSSFLFFF